MYYVHIFLMTKKGDFGLSLIMDILLGRGQVIMNDPYWTSPELIEDSSNANNDNNISTKTDIWSLGMTAMEMCLGRVPYHNETPLQIIWRVPNKSPPKLKPNGQFSNQFIDFIAQCLTKNPSKRPSASKLLKHEWIKQAQTIRITQEIVYRVIPLMDKMKVNDDEEDDEDNDDSFDPKEEAIEEKVYDTDEETNESHKSWGSSPYSTKRKNIPKTTKQGFMPPNLDTNNGKKSSINATLISDADDENSDDDNSEDHTLRSIDEESDDDNKDENGVFFGNNHKTFNNMTNMLPPNNPSTPTMTKSSSIFNVKALFTSRPALENTPSAPPTSLTVKASNRQNQPQSARYGTGRKKARNKERVMSFASGQRAKTPSIISQRKKNKKRNFMVQRPTLKQGNKSMKNPEQESVVVEDVSSSDEDEKINDRKNSRKMSGGNKIIGFYKIRQEIKRDELGQKVICKGFHMKNLVMKIH